MMGPVSLFGIEGLPEIQPGDDLARLTIDAAERQNTPLKVDDVIVITQKVVSKSENRIVRLGDVDPSAFARNYADAWEKDPRVVELVLSEAKRVVRMENAVLITETLHGFRCANSGIDASNVGPESDETVTLLPIDPDASALRIKNAFENLADLDIAIIISDTFGRPWRLGQVNVAIGIAGIPATIKEIGNHDAWGRELRVTEPAFADELAAASGLLMKKAAKTPLIFIRGLKWEFKNSKTSDIIRKKEEDMFR